MLQEEKTAMIPTLSIRIPISFTYYAPRVLAVPLPKNYYDSWTASDYALAYHDTNETPFTWDDVDVPRRSSRRTAKKAINYKI
jgi:hypothetical protein